LNEVQHAEKLAEIAQQMTPLLDRLFRAPAIAAEVEELRAAAVPTSTIANLYPLDFQAFPSRIEEALTKKNSTGWLASALLGVTSASRLLPLPQGLFGEVSRRLPPVQWTVLTYFTRSSSFFTGLERADLIRLIILTQVLAEGDLLKYSDRPGAYIDLAYAKVDWRGAVAQLLAIMQELTNMEALLTLPQVPTQQAPMRLLDPLRLLGHPNV
jgi:hypothetical protein